MHSRYVVGLVAVVVAGLLCLALTIGVSDAPHNDQAIALFCMSEAQLDLYLKRLATQEQDPIARLKILASQNVGQPHQDVVLGEGGYDSADPRPLFDLTKSNSLSCVEQLLAMSLSDSFEEFFLVLQRFRYKNGVITTANRNHNLLCDWVPNNEWVLDDVDSQLGEEMAWVPAHQIVRRRDFLKERFGVTVDTQDEKFIGSFIPRVYWYRVYLPASF